MDLSGDSDRDKFTKSIKPKAKSDAPDKYDVFLKWLVDNGTKFPKLELVDYGDEVRGCHAKNNVNAEEILVEVPLSCLITVEMGKETPIGKAIMASNIELDAPKHIFLMVYMLIDMKNSNSFFKPYYDILPTNLSNMPIFWTDEELALLEGSYMLQQIEERKKAIENDYKLIKSIYPNLVDLCDLREFMWARMCVCSRNFGLVINGVRTAALVPFADMLNHYRPRESKWQFDDTLQGFTITAVQKISIGAQVYDSYGQKCNHRFLLNYGFSVENNVEPDGFCPNEVAILLSLRKSDPLYNQKFALTREQCFPSRRVRVCVGDNENSRLMFAMLRIIEADQQELNTFLDSSRSIRDAQVPRTCRNELKVLQHLKQICDEYLANYPNSFEEDIARLSSSSVEPFSNERHAIIQVKGEKQVLLFYKDFAETGISFLNTFDETLLELELNNIKSKKHILIQNYIKSLLPLIRNNLK